MSKLARYHVQFNAVLPEPRRECVSQIVKPDVRSFEQCADPVKGHADVFRCSHIGKEQIVRVTVRNGFQHVLSKGVQVDFLRLVILRRGKQNPGAVNILPFAPEQFRPAHSGCGEQGKNGLHFLRGGCQHAAELVGAEFVKKEQYAEVEQEFRLAVSLAPQEPDLHYSLGEVLWYRANVDGAIAEDREALRLNPKNDNAHVNLGTALGRKGDVDGAIARGKTGLLPKNLLAPVPATR